MGEQIVYFDHIIFGLDELLLSTEFTSSDHLKKLGIALLDVTRSDNRICKQLTNRSSSRSEDNSLFLKKTLTADSTVEDKLCKYWRVYSLHMQNLLKGRGLFTHFRILL